MARTAYEPGLLAGLRHPVRLWRAFRAGFLLAYRTGDRELAERRFADVWEGRADG